MLKKIVGWVVLVPLCAVLILFALANRQSVLVRFDPFSEAGLLLPAVSMPLFLVIFALLVIGILLGGSAAWLAQAPQRRDKRHWRRQAERLEKENAALRRPGHAVPQPARLDADDIL